MLTLEVLEPEAPHLGTLSLAAGRKDQAVLLQLAFKVTEIVRAI